MWIPKHQGDLCRYLLKLVVHASLSVQCVVAISVVLGSFVCSFVCVGLRERLSGPWYSSHLYHLPCIRILPNYPLYFRIPCFFLCLNLFVSFVLNANAEVCVVMEHLAWLAVCWRLASVLFSLLDLTTAMFGLSVGS